MVTRVSHAAQSFRGWLIMAPTAVTALFLGRIAAIGFIFGLAMLGLLEYARATGLVRDRLLLGAALIEQKVRGASIECLGAVELTLVLGSLSLRDDLRHRTIRRFAEESHGRARS